MIRNINFKQVQPHKKAAVLVRTAQMKKNICFKQVEIAKEQVPCEVSLTIETIQALGN